MHRQVKACLAPLAPVLLWLLLLLCTLFVERCDSNIGSLTDLQALPGLHLLITLAGTSHF